MKSLVVLGLAGLWLAAPLNAGNLTEDNTERTKAVIEAAVDAYGGAERLAAMKSIIIENKDTGYATGQSRKTSPPWDENHSTGVTAIDMENNIFVTRNNGSGGGFEFHNGTIINGDNSYQLDYRAGTAAPIAEPNFDNASGPFIRVTPALLVRQLQTHRRTAHFLGEKEIDGRDHEVVGFSMVVGPAISLYFDKQSHLLTHSERVIPGFGLVEYRFHDQKPIDGIPFNRRFELFLNGDANLDRTVLNTRVNVPIDALVTRDAGLKTVATVEPDPLSRQEISDGVYLIGGNGTYAMFVEMSEYVVAIGGTAGIADRIDQLREVIPEKPIQYGVMTHHHFDHVMGVQVYADEGATIIAAAAHEEVVRNAASEPENLKLITVDRKRKILKDQSRRIEIIDIGPTAHTEHLLVTWLPEEGILFEADHFAMPRTGPVPPAVSSTKTFAKALRKFKLKPKMMVSAHSPRTGTADDLKEAVDKEVAAVRAGAP